jgi:hypothetical protein
MATDHNTPNTHSEDELSEQELRAVSGGENSEPIPESSQADTGSGSSSASNPSSSGGSTFEGWKPPKGLVPDDKHK